MYVLTLWQPWATLHAAGIKTNETRTGRPSARYYPEGVEVLVHAAQKKTKAGRELAEDPEVASLLKGLGYPDFDSLPFGAVVGQVEYHGSRKAELVHPDDLEQKLGCYGFGRFVLFGVNHRLLLDPLPYKNGQGFYQTFKGDVGKLVFKIG